MAQRSYEDFEEAVRAARMDYDHSKAKMISKKKTVRKSRNTVFLSNVSTQKPNCDFSFDQKGSTKSPIRCRKSTEAISKSTESRPKSNFEELHELQIFVKTPLASTVCLKLNPSATVSEIKSLLQDRLGIDIKKQHLVTLNNFELCDMLSLDDHGIMQDTNLELRLVTGLMGGRRRRKREKSGKDDAKKETDPNVQGDHSSGKERKDKSKSTTTSVGDSTRNAVAASAPAAATAADAATGATAAGATANPAENATSTAAAAPAPNEPPLPPTSGSNKTINVAGDKNKVTVEGDTTTYNVCVVPMGMDIEKESVKENVLTNLAYYILQQDNGEKILRKVLQQHDTNIAQLRMGSVIFDLQVRSRKGLDSLWDAYTSGQLAKQFAEAIITNELIPKGKGDFTIRLIIQESDYLRGCRFFEKIENDNKQADLPSAMSLWTEEHVRRWLLSVGITSSTADQFKKENVNGKLLKKYTRKHLIEDFELTKGKMRQILYSRDEWLENENQQIKRTSEEHAKSNMQSSEVEEAPVSRTPDMAAGKNTNTEPSSGSTVTPVSLDGQQYDPSVRPKTRMVHGQPTPVVPIKKTIRSSTSPGRAQIPSTKHVPEQEQTLLSRSAEGTSQRLDSHEISKQFADEDDCHKTAKSRASASSSKMDFDDQNKPCAGTTPTDPNQEARLRMLLTADKQGELDRSFYPILVANKPPIAPSDCADEEQLHKQFAFIKTIKWSIVLDLNSKSLENGLCKLYRDDRRVTLQRPDLFKDIRSIEELKNSIDFPEKTLWIFANGREDDPSITTPRMDLPEWNTERSKDVEESVGFFSNPAVIPSGRETIVFLLLSEEDIGIICDIFRKMSSSFKGLQNITCIAENEDVYSTFVAGVERWFKKDEIDKRSVIGLSWSEVNRIVMKMNGVNQIGENELPFVVKGMQCFFSEKQRDEWNDITVLRKNECENTDMDENSTGYQKFAERKELNFYRGEMVDWWNLSISERIERRRLDKGHVLKRKGFGEMLRKLVKPLDSTATEDLIVTITLFHEPGSGGSTLARHVLWELHREHRCVVVNRITTTTVNQILQVRKKGYQKENAENIPPVCVLIDDFDEVEVLDLIGEMEEASKNIHMEGRAVCVFLHCQRIVDPMKVIKKGRKELHIPLTQKLGSEEKKWFQEKYDELEQKESKFQNGFYNPENLIAFMVMKEEFNKEYIENVVKRILTHEGMKANEIRLIKYCALLNSYMHEAEIPIFCCDSFMADNLKNIRTTYLTKKRTPNWEKLASAPFKILVTFTEDKGIKIFHRSIAEEVLKQTCQSEDQPLAEVTLEFLNSQLLLSPSYSRINLERTTHNLLVRRTMLAPGEATKTSFSLLIEDVHKSTDQGLQKAVEILKTGVDKLEDPFVSQQLARLFLKEQKFDQAQVYADKTLKLNPKNSYFWHTKGRIQQIHANTLSEPFVVNRQTLGTDGCKKIISLSFKAMDAFHKSYEVSNETRKIEYVGLNSEVDVAFRLLKTVYSCVEPFRTRGDENTFKEYLLQLNSAADLKPEWDSECESKIRELKTRVDSVLDVMHDNLIYYKDGSSANIHGAKLEEMREKLSKLLKTYKQYYGEPKPYKKSRYAGQDPKTLAEFRRRQVTDYGCWRYFDIFDLSRENKAEMLDKSYKLLQENSDDYSFSDLKTLICIHLALSSLNKQSISADEVYQEFVRPLNYVDDSTSTNCWPSLFMTMFLWPLPNVESERRDKEDLEFYIDRLRLRSEHGQAPCQEKVMRHIRFNRKSRTHFFLGKGHDLRVFVHINEILASPSNLDRPDFWQSDIVQERLVRLDGTLLDNISLIHRSHKGNRIRIRLAVPYLSSTPSQEKVSFFLGFSWSGPVAYNVTPKDREFCDDTVPRKFDKAYPEYILQSTKQKTNQDDDTKLIERLQMDVKRLSEKLQCMQQAHKEGYPYKETINTLEEKKAELTRVWIEGSADFRP